MAFHFAANVADLTEGAIVACWPDEEPVALTLRAGKVIAFANVCTHDDGPLDEGAIEACGDGALCAVCPRHGAKFDLSTGKGGFPAAGPIRIYETQIDAKGRVLVDL
jgi:3-phenylpropionate/trans-cinnamate dioxygenase ferredoxin component